MNEKKLKVMVAPELKNGVYSNVAQVNGTPREIVFDFAFVQPNSDDAALVSRVIFSFEHALDFRKALDSVLKKYETGKKKKK